jgi:hypothetical protein
LFLSPLPRRVGVFSSVVPCYEFSIAGQAEENCSFAPPREYFRVTKKHKKAIGTDNERIKRHCTRLSRARLLSYFGKKARFAAPVRFM